MAQRVAHGSAVAHAVEAQRGVGGKTANYTACRGIQGISPEGVQAAHADAATGSGTQLKSAHVVPLGVDVEAVIHFPAVEVEKQRTGFVVAFVFEQPVFQVIDTCRGPKLPPVETV